MAAHRSEIADSVYMPLEQYLALDETTDGKYEYLDGFVFMLRPPSSAYNSQVVLDLAGGSIAHAAICGNIGTVLNNALRDGPCVFYTSDAKVKLAEKQYLYPDGTVAYGEQEDPQYIVNPTLIIEVLSPYTEKRDRNAKFKAYKRIPSFSEYLLIGSEYKSIEVHRREGSFWKPFYYREGDIVELTSLDITFPFEEVYYRVKV